MSLPLSLLALATGCGGACACQPLRLSLAGVVICSPDKCLAHRIQTQRRRWGRCRVGSQPRRRRTGPCCRCQGGCSWRWRSSGAALWRRRRRCSLLLMMRPRCGRECYRAPCYIVLQQLPFIC